MDFDIPKEIADYLDVLDDFIEQEMADSGIRDFLLVSSRRKKVMEEYFDREIEEDNYDVFENVKT